MDSVIAILLLLNLEYALGDVCSKYGYTFSHSVYYSYCSGYCSGSYGYQYCRYDTGSLSYGYIVGIVLASIAFLVIVVIVIIVACSSCTKRAGTSGRIIHPVNTPGGLAVVHSNSIVSGPRLYTTAPSVPPYSSLTYGSLYPPTVSAFPPPPSTYTSFDEEYQGLPPSYSSLSTRSTRRSQENQQSATSFNMGSRLPPIQQSIYNNS